MLRSGPRPIARWLGAVRILLAGGVLAVIAHAYLLVVAAGDPNPFDHFGYFTNLTGVLTCGILLASGAIQLSGRPEPGGITLARGAAVACMIIVGVVYNVLVPGTGSAPPWVSAILHIAFPVLVLLDWLVLPPPAPPRWRELWVILPYPLLWLAVVLVRGATDGWVPYGFLLPERGPASLLAHIAGLLAALLLAGALVWATARVAVAGGRPGPQHRPSTSR